MARKRPRQSALSPNGRRRTGDVRRKTSLSISFQEAADLVAMHPRTLKQHLVRTDARCLVRIGKRYRIDRKGFYRWCRQIGFESAATL